MKNLSNLTRLLVLTLFACVIYSAKFSGPSETFSSTEEFVKLLGQTQAKNGLFGDLENTYYSVKSLQLLKKEVPNKNSLCNAVPTNSASSLAQAFYAVQTLKSLGCNFEKTEYNSQAIKSLSSSSNRDLHQAVSILSATQSLASAGKELDKVARTILGLKEEDGTFRSATTDSSESTSADAGLAFLTLSELYSSVSKDVKSEIDALAYEVENLFSKATSKGKTLFFEDGDDHQENVRATSLVIQGINALSRVISKKIDVTQEQVAKLSEFFVQNQDVSSPRDVFHVVSGVDAVANNPFFTPIVASVVSDTLVAKSSDSNIKIRVTDLFGNFATAAKVIITSISPFNAPERVLIKNQDLFAEDKDEKKNTVYFFNFLSSKPEAGLYSVSFSVTPSSKKHISSTEERVVRVVTGVSIHECSVQAAEESDGLNDASKASCDAGKIEDVIRNDFTPFVRVSFKVRNAASGKPAPIQQAFLKLANPDTHQEIIYVAKLNEKNFYTVSLNLTSRHLARNNLVTGRYTLELIIGDSFIQTATIHPVADLRVASPEGKLPETNLGPKPLINHIFRQPEKRPSESFSVLWTGIVLAPFLILFFGAPLVGGNIYDFPLGLSFVDAVGFHVCLGAIFALFVLFWFFLNMFQTLGLLTVLLIPTTYFGKRNLQALSLKH